MRILIAEDELTIARALKVMLEKNRYAVDVVHNGNDALDYMQATAYDALVLDIMMPGKDGIEVLKAARAAGNATPALFLTAKAEIADRVAGLDAGADDYLPKPFHLAELNARIKSVIRRQHHDGEIDICLGNIRILPDKYQVLINDREVELNRKEYDILLYFINRPGRLVNKNTLAESVWGDHIDQVDNFDFIYAQIKNLRKKLKDAGATAEIKAVYGFGYKMIVE